MRVKTRKEIISVLFLVDAKMSITISEIKTLITKNQTIDWTISILYRILHVPRYD